MEGEGKGDRAESTQRAIMEATYRALCDHGYAGTSISKIADEFEKSKSLLYYHYDDKEELLEDFLIFVLERFQSELKAETEEPLDRLTAVLDWMAPRDIDDEQLHFCRALLELRSQAAYDEDYRDSFEMTDALIYAELYDIVESGVEEDVFAVEDPEATAEFLRTLLYGTLAYGIPMDDRSGMARQRELVDAYLDAELLADDQSM